MKSSTLEIVIVAGGMAFGPTTLAYKSLGGSETAVIGAAIELRKRGHIVTVFCPLPQNGPDAWPSGQMCADGVRWVSIDNYANFIVATEVDLLVVSRSPELLQFSHQAKKAVLWCHDLATYNGPSQGIIPVAWNFDEIWCVSEWHRQQYHKITGYPLENLVATRNGIMKYDFDDHEWLGRNPTQLVYAARPERGLINLVRPGGIMERLPEFNLKVTMYDNFPPHMADFYGQLFSWANALPNVEILPPSKQDELRLLIRTSAAYVYPTDFEETSCMLARECIEQKTPMITTMKGALPETLGDCGVFFRSFNEFGSDQWCEEYAAFVRSALSPEILYDPMAELAANCAKRADLYWDGVAEQWEALAATREVQAYSRAWSLVEDSDIIAAEAFLQAQLEYSGDDWAQKMLDQLHELYPYLWGTETLASYYERYFVREDTKGARTRHSQVGSPRFEAISDQVASLHTGACVLDYGCAEGVIILDLAARFPDKAFHGVDHAQTNVDLCTKYASEMGLKNVSFSRAEDPGELMFKAMHDAAICSEVLEHVPDPWALIGRLEEHVKEGGKIIITVPQGPWEAIGLYNKDQWHWRAHIWHINKWMLRQMFTDKQDCQMISLFNGHQADGRMLGHLVFTYTADHVPAHAIDPLEKAYQSRCRETVTACMIVKNGEDTILKTLKSLDGQVQKIVIGLSNDTEDFTDGLIFNFAKNRPWLDVQVIQLPPIQPGQFGFDDARNATIANLDTDWFLWIDSDEYISGNFQRYLRYNAFDTYAIHQHHFTCDPRGAPTMLDKPARLCRTDRGLTFFGKVHEHAEKGFNGGPGFSFILGDVDIGHTGYVNEGVRRNRFSRNYPLLQWDRQVNPDRKLGKYLWLRDIIHMMRYSAEQRDVQGARLLAEEAVQFYSDNWAGLDDAGMGGMNALQYVSEARGMLNKGLPVSVAVSINNEQMTLEGVFESGKSIADLIEQALQTKFDQRDSGYWQ